jgi:hypothetical protein
MTATKKYAKRSDTPAYRKQWRIERHQGKTRVVDTAEVSEHLHRLVKQHNCSLEGIAAASGVGEMTISRLHRGLLKTIRRSNAEALLAVTPDKVRPNGEVLVPNIGGRRRIQALMAIGWRHKDLTPLLGLPSANIVYQDGQWFTKRKHDAIKRVYDQLWNKPGPGGALVIKRAEKAGYSPPLAWDDETIDDPAAVPNLGAKVSNIGMTAPGTVRKTDAVIEDVEFLLEEGLDWDAITTRLCLNPVTLDRALHRRGRADLINRGKNMAERRAYARAS